MNNLIQKIQDLPREEVLEAAGFVGRKLVEDIDAGEDEKNLLKPLTDQPYQHIEEIEQLARLVLLSAALTPEYEETVRQAVEGAGQKQVILGGMEIIVLSVIALRALQVIVTKDVAAKSEVIKIEEKNGVTTTTIKRQVTNQTGINLSSILKQYFGLGGR